MKKLMTVLASAATALFAIGVAKGDDFTTQGTGFEDYSEGAVFDAQKDDAGGTSGDKYWYSTASAGEIGEISNHVDTVAAALVPDYFENAGIGNRYLHIDTSAPLFRSAEANTQDGSFTAVDIGDGIYLDTLVQFTAADDEFQSNLDSGDKIAISYVEHEDDETTTDVNEAWTNFVIRAGAIVDDEFDQANYYAAVPANFDKEAWHRLTVRTIKNVGDGQVGFVIYLDGDMSKTLNFTNQVNTGFTVANLSPLAKSFYDVNALYPSAVNSGDDKSTISAASFSGTGALDDVVFTATKPSFITEQASVTIAWTEGVATVKIGDAEAIACTGAGSEVVDLPASGTVLVAVTFAEGYEAGTYTVEPPGAQGSWDSTTGGFVNLADGNVCTIVAVQPKFDVAGVHYDNLAYALAAAISAGTAQTPATLKLLANCGECITVGSGYVIIDLAGHDIQGGNEDTFSINCKDNANVIVTNSVPSTGAVKVSLMEDAAAAMQLKGDAVRASVYDTKFEGSIKVAPDEVEETALLKIFSGTFFDDSADGDVENFKYAKYIQNSAKVTYLSNNYFQVGEGGEQPTTYSVSFSSGEGYTVTDITNVTDGKAEAGATVTFKVTVASGFDATTLVVKNGETELVADEGVYSVTVNAAVAITITVEEEQSAALTLTITPNENADATVTINGEPAETGAEIVAGNEIVVTATPKENFEYAQTPEGWAAGQAGAITKTITVVDANVTVEIPAPTAKQQGGYPTYIDTTDADAKAKYDAWKATYGDDTASVYEDAFLLNCAPANVDAEKAAFKFTSITQNSEGEWVVETTTKNTDGADYNGEVVVTRYSDVGCTVKNEAGPFFKAELK